MWISPPFIGKKRAWIPFFSPPGAATAKDGMPQRTPWSRYSAQREERLPFSVPPSAQETMFSENTLRPDDPQAIRDYFRELLDLRGKAAQDQHGIMELLNQLAFRQTEETFHLIENNTHTVYVSLPESERLIARLLEGERSKGLMRKLSLYSLSIYDQHYQELYRAGDIRPIDGENGVLVNSSLYAMHTGLSLKADSGRAEFI